MPTSAFYSLWSGPATTLSAQSVISTTETTFEAFVADNYLFLDLTECVHWLNVVIDEDVMVDSWINREITRDMVYDRLSSKFINFKSSYEEPLRSYIHNLTQDQLIRVYYKNNLIQFVEDHEYMKILHELIFQNVHNLKYVDEYLDKKKKIFNDSWRNEIRDQDGYEEEKFKEPKDWNKYVNKQFFMDPNDVPESIKEYVEKFSENLFKYVYVRYLSFDRIYRLKNFKRKTVTVIDTDSNILSLDTWVNYVLDHLLKDNYGRSKDNNVFIIINTITYAITQVVTDILLTYGKYSNVPKEYRPRYNMKNEFMFGKLVIGKTKKRYLSKIILREGNLNNPPKYDIKGFDFMKATTSEESEKFYRYLVKKYILDPEEIDTSALYTELKHYQTKIYESLRRGERTYLPNANAKELEAYKEPAQEQSVRGTLAWNYLYPENMIEYPSKVSIVKLNIFKEEDIFPLKDKEPEIYNTIMNRIFYDETGIFVSRKREIDKKTGEVKETVKSRGMQVLAIPSNARIPEWALDYVDYTTMINNIIAPFKSVLEILGVKLTSVGKSVNGVNRKTEKLTNIIRF